MTDADHFAPLLAGYRRFRTGDWAGQRARWEELATGQAPKVLVIACSDSRVDPAQIFDSGPGELFIVRNVANLVPPYEVGGGLHGVSAALEFAVTQLEVTDVLVMGHGSCGGVKAAMTEVFAGAAPGEGGFVANWVALLNDARDEVRAAHGDGPEAVRELEYAGVRTSLANLRTFPFVAEREAAGSLRLRGGHFAIADGVLRVMDEHGAFTAATAD